MQPLHTRQDSGVYESLPEDPLGEMKAEMLEEKRKLLGEDAELSPADEAKAQEILMMPTALEGIRAYREWQKEVEMLEGIFSVRRQTFTDLEQKAERADIDANTEARSRTFFKGYLQLKLEEVAETRNSPEQRRETDKHAGFSLIMLDVDNFKTINDTLGHNGGDAVLSNIVHAAKGKLRDTDVIGRWGGDEFMILVEANEEIAEKRAEEIRQIIETEVSRQDLGEAIGTVSVGVAHHGPEDPEIPLEELVHKADTAAYVSKKKKGRNAVTVYDPEKISEQDEKAASAEQQAAEKIAASVREALLGPI